MRIFLLGLPGAGKGTQGKLLSSALNIPHISLGDVARGLAKSGAGELADKIRQIHQQPTWQPLPTEIAVQLFHTMRSSFVLDGFPRDLEQKQAVNWELEWENQNIFIHLKISEEESKRRVLSRDRKGDSLEKWRARIELERVRLPELIKNISYDSWCGRNWNYLIEIDSEKTKEEVHQSILQHPVIYFFAR